MKNFSIILLLAAFAAQTFSKELIMLDYYANRAAFAKDCVNKARPMLHCNGKCQMMKKIQEQEKKQDKNPEQKADNKNEVVDWRSFLPDLTSSFVLLENTHRVHNTDLLPSQVGRSVFHPPATGC